MSNHRQTAPRRPYARSAALAVAIALASSIACAQPAWKPERPVEFVIGASPGGGLDLTARVIQRILNDQGLVRDVQIVHRPGGSLTVSWAYLGQHARDAHYVSIANEPLLTNRIMGTTSLGAQDFTPLALMFTDYVVFLVRPDSPLKGPHDLAERLRKDPGGLAFGFGSSRGNNTHVSIGLLGRASGADLKNIKTVVFKSGGEAITALLGGHIDVAANSIAPAMSHLRAGRVRAIAVTSERRLAGELAAVPTLKELKLDVTYASWRVIFGPRDLGPAQIAFWEDALLKVTQSADWKNELQKNQQENAYRSAEETRRFLAAEEARLRTLLADLGLAKPNQ